MKAPSVSDHDVSEIDESGSGPDLHQRTAELFGALRSSDDEVG